MEIVIFVLAMMGAALMVYLILWLVGYLVDYHL
jgi:hypothetical protein